MTAAQETLAVDLLREALDWVGITLTAEEEERAEDVQRRIERLLADLGALPCQELLALARDLATARQVEREAGEEADRLAAKCREALLRGGRRCCAGR